MHSAYGVVIIMNINEILNIKYPIIQGGMAHIATGTFAAAVSEAGALGTIGSGAMKPERLEEEIKICKSKTSKPFSVNLFMLNPRIEDMVNVIIRNDVKIVSVGAGYPGKYLKILRDNGILVLPLVSSPSQAQYLDKKDITAFIAEGMEAGGHIGDMPTMVLIPQVREASTHPIIAAGGIVLHLK
ncbi:enoyl-[acyl carrier protein] reductase II [Peptoniphilus sp. ING2-D1G]|nr:enoyl-[acyl carrier protein] reductase II [Peptoniphilus sp. ING2-D1G]